MSALTDDRELALGLQPALAPPRVNLLPPEIGQRSRLRRVQLGVGCVLLTVVGIVASLSMTATAALQEAAGELDAASTRGAALQAQSAKYVDVLAVHRRADAAQDMLALAMAEEVRFSELLDELSRTVPDKVWLEDVTFSQHPASQHPALPAAGGPAARIGTVTFTGAAFSHDDVAAWLDALATREGYADSSLTESTASAQGAGRTVRFTSTVALTSAALSDRHSSTTAED
jgi:Tfp pilus assembly protein PilN